MAINDFHLPSQADVDALLGMVRSVLFPEVFGTADERRLTLCLEGHIRAALQAAVFPLSGFSALGGIQASASAAVGSASAADVDAAAAARSFMESLPRIAELLRADIQAATVNDPAATSYIEVMCCYPAFTAMLHYRVAHALHGLGVPLLPRIITERAHSTTGIDIHPAAQIGPAFGIDHGTGIVIGATAIIGTHVMVYQGVTLGARHFDLDSEGRPKDLPRHPIVEDYVTVYSNTSLLGRIRIGHHSVIGGNLWITHDVPPYSQVRQVRPEEYLGQKGSPEGCI